jgi:prepilin-type N-terminal cleavage/methylation domain-containing protein
MMKKRSNKGFTLVEMLVVIGIIGLLMGVLMTGFSYAQTLAWQAQSQELVSNVATALGLYIQKEGSWPEEFLRSNGNVNNEVCKVLQQANLLDVTTISKFNDDGTVEVNQNSPERFGLFSPWGRRIIRKNPKTNASIGSLCPISEANKHILQFRLDVNLDGKIDSTDSTLGVIPGEGIKIRASAIVWSCGPLGKADGSWGAKSLQDNRQSWTGGQ